MNPAAIGIHLPSKRRLLRSLEEACRRELEELGFKMSNIGTNEWGDALRAYCRVMHRSIEPKMRTVKYSRELLSQVKEGTDSDLVARVKLLEKEVREGQDLNVRLSRKYYRASFNDPLLNDLSVQHFHLGDRSELPTALCKPYSSPSLLFGHVDQESIYLIHLGDHDSFRETAFERIMFDNWPHLLTELAGITPGKEQWSSEERAKARRSGLSPIVQFNGKSYMPPGSVQTMDGTSIGVIHRVNQLIHQVEEGRNWLTERAEWLRESMAKHGRDARVLSLSVHVTGLTVWFVDWATQTWICWARRELHFPPCAVLQSLRPRQGEPA